MAISLVSYRTKTAKYTEQRNYKSEIVANVNPKCNGEFICYRPFRPELGYSHGFHYL